MDALKAQAVLVTLLQQRFEVLVFRVLGFNILEHVDAVDGLLAVNQVNIGAALAALVAGAGTLIVLTLDWPGLPDFLRVEEGFYNFQHACILPFLWSLC